MTPLDAAHPLPAEGPRVTWPFPPPRRTGPRLGAAARRAARIEREQQRIQADWHARGKRERVRQMGERLISSVEQLRKAEAGVVLAESGILAELVRGNRFESLGFVRQSDFAREALRLHPRTLRRRVALHRMLAAVPELVDPFLQGRAGVSQVLALRDVVTAENAKIWVNMAERLSVRELQSLVRRVKENREREEASVGGDAADPAENVVRPGDGGTDPTENVVPEDDPLQEPRRQAISFLSPQSAAFAIEHGLEAAKRVLGYEAPRDECLEAVLSEAESTLALPPVTDTQSPWSDTAENVVRPKAPTSDTESTTDPNTVPIWYHKRELKAAKRLLTTVDRKLAKIARLAGGPRPGGGSPAGSDSQEDPGPSTATGPSEDLRHLTAGALIDRYHALERQKNPIRIFIARALYHLCMLGAGGLLGYRSDLDMAAKLLRITPRSARDLLNAGFAFNYFPPLADAYSRGRIGFGQVVALSYEVSATTRTWIQRARQVTARQFRREVRLLRRLRDCGGNMLGFDDHAFPRPELEAVLRKHLFELGWKQEELDRELGKRGILSPPGTSTDPAENPAQMARLETLADMLALEICRQEDMALNSGAKVGRPGLGKTLSVPGRHQRVTILARDPIAYHWHDAQARILTRCDHLPDWAVATVLFKAAQDEWDRTDPARIPTERKILERDGYLCQAPGCSSRKNLEVHHIIFRSFGGSSEDWNLVTLCHMHHHHAVHHHTMLVTGEAPYNLTWEMGLRADASPRWVYHGEKLAPGG